MGGVVHCFIMDVSTSTLAAAVQGVRALVSAYDGYEKRPIHEIGRSGPLLKFNDAARC